MGAKSLITALVLLSRGSVSCRSRSPFMGCPASPFIGEGKARVITEEKEKNEREREKKTSKVIESFFSFMRVPLIL